ncbi:DUF1294 domain-containing protein [Ottowia sp. GY511]|uniref:DUF1294 domain-containing protein n=1 Tax=Ottowia flava TaxID=2675430 RepID=A0ABW4KPE3_9BURK|nr:cold shock and DUF1294 domain-containing protein [Ottowia sp. GY511]TXK26455.1 DUF1294 domain-containing protein [Ottowia sp. GY511]
MTQDGEILRFDAERGFGFIATADGQRNIFFHVRDFRSDALPRVGERVRFERIDVGGKGPRAMAVQPLAGARQSGVNAPGRATPAQRPADRPARSQPSRNASAPSRRDSGSNDHRRAHEPQGLDGQPVLFVVALLVWIGLLATLTWRGAWPVSAVAVLGGLALLNAATFMAYAFDKSAAEQGRWRTAESTLHSLALLGGWPAAWLAQRALRHKSRKQPFLSIYVATIVLHLGALAALLWRAS